MEVGLNVTDIECLDKSLKTRQFIRAEKSKHLVKRIQIYCLGEIGCREVILQGNSKITNIEGGMMVAQLTINTFNTFTIDQLNEGSDNYLGDKLAIKYAGSINESTYSKMSKNIYY